MRIHSRAMALLATAAVPGCASTAPKPANPLRDADLIQSVLHCMADFEASSAQHPETLTLANGPHVTAYGTFRFGTPKVRLPQSTGYATCRFAVVRWPGARGLAYPACKRSTGWTAFGSGYGRITWATPTIACAPAD